ncbi:MAG TPA: AraC family transcriptional regulator [Planctomycetaceae bacterium]|nr:AraC family transcriptional regulator [Planctomycetaceae bacterium]
MSVEKVGTLATSKLPQYEDGETILLPDRCENILASVAAGKVRMEALSRGHYPGARLPRGVMPGLKTVGFFHADREQHWGTGWHCNEGIEVSYVEKGHVDFVTDKETHQLEPGDATVTWPWQRHCLGNPNISPTRFYWLTIDVGVRRRGEHWRWPQWMVLRPEERDELTRRVMNLDGPVFHGVADLGRCFQRIGDFLAAGEGEHSWALLTVLINEVFAILLEQLRRETAHEKDSHRLSLDVVGRFWRNVVEREESLASPWTLAELARRCGFGVTQFVHHTQSLTNSAPMHYLRQCRLRRAARLLHDDRHATITEVAMRCGFSSGQHFARLFRQQFGLSPQTYRWSKSEG